MAPILGGVSRSQAPREGASKVHVRFPPTMDIPIHDSKIPAASPISLLARGPGGRGSRKRGEESPGSTEQRCRVTPGGSRFGEAQGKCHRKYTACLWAGKVERVRQERTAGAATSPARKTPPGARPNRGGEESSDSGASSGPVARVGCLRGGVTRLLEEWPHRRSDALDRTRLTGPLAIID